MRIFELLFFDGKADVTAVTKRLRNFWMNYNGYSEVSKNYVCCLESPPHRRYQNHFHIFKLWVILFSLETLLDSNCGERRINIFGILEDIFSKAFICFKLLISFMWLCFVKDLLSCVEFRSGMSKTKNISLFVKNISFHVKSNNKV